MRLYEEGAIRPAVTVIFPLAEVARAHALVESRASTGKVLLQAD
jgi:NADPH:quinone reductase-like Zn-dependent oxidoreductase